MKRKYRLVSGCLIVVLSCMCGLSACGSAQTNNNANSASSSSISNDSSSKNSSENVSLEDIAKKCNFKYSDDGDSLSINHFSGKTFKKDYACAIKNANPGDSVAEKLSAMLPSSSNIKSFSTSAEEYLNNFEDENYYIYIEYVPPYFGGTYYVYPTLQGFEIAKFK